MEKDRGKSGIIINANLIVSIFSSLFLAYTGYIIKTMDNRMERMENRQDANWEFINQCQTKVMEVKEIINTHLAWHTGKKENNKKTEQ